MKKYEEMTVDELKAESRARGLKLQENGKKFKKSELIERLKNNDSVSVNAVETTEKAEEPETKPEVKEVVETNSNENKEHKIFSVDHTDRYIHFAKTLEEIETKYSHRKPQNVYDDELKVGSFVVFMHYVEAKNGEIYKKLRTAKVVGVNRRLELVNIQTLLGTEKQLSFDDLLYIKGCQGCCGYPKDITTYLKDQRTEKGRNLINERFNITD